MYASKFVFKILAGLERLHWYLIFAVIFKIALEIGYVNFVAVIFEYEGYVLEVDGIKYIESWCLYLVLLYNFPKKLVKASDYLVNYMLFSFLCPLLVYYAMSDSARSSLYIVLAAVVLIMYFREGGMIPLPFIKDGERIVYGLMLIGVIVVSGWLIYSGGFNFFNLDFELVYEFRDDVGALIDQGVMGYLNVWATKVFGPVLLALGLWRRNYFLVMLVFALHIFWFGVTSHKSVVFYPFLITFLWIWFARTRALVLIPIGMTVVIVSSFFWFLMYDDLMAGSMFIRRLFFVPAKLTFAYYEFFSGNPFIYWSNSIASGIIEYPYSINPALLIGDYLGGGDYANNSFLSTGYMHAGIPGILLYALLVGLLFRLIDSLGRSGVPVWVAAAALIVPSQSLITSSDLPTALLTHGLGVSIFVLFMLRSSSVSIGSKK